MCNSCDWSTTTWRDNDEFITQTGFWDNSPTSCDIVAALYGTGVDDGTAYTQHRSGYSADCDIGGMVVQYKNPGTNQIRGDLDDNTIYVLYS